MEDTNSSFETGADDSSADPPAEIRPLVLLLAGDIDAGHEHADEDADETGSTSSSTGSTSSSQQKEESRAKLEEEMGQAVDALQRSEEARVELSSGLGIEAAERCDSAESYQRIGSLLANALVIHADISVGRSTDESSKVPSEEDSTILVGLARSLCRVLALSKSPEIMDESASIVVEELSSKDSCVESLRALVEPLLRVARDGSVAAAKAKGGKRCVDVGPALSVLEGVITTLTYGKSATPNEQSEWRKEMLQLLLSSTLTGGRFAPSAEVGMFCVYLSSLTQQDFDETVAPAIGLKLRANPDGALETANGLLSALIASGSDIDLAAHIEGETKLLATGMRQLRSAKEDMRSLAVSFMVNITVLNGGNAVAEGGAIDIVVASITEALTRSKPAKALSTPEQRLSVYNILERMAAHQLDRSKAEDSGELSDDEKKVLASVTDGALVALSQTLSKDNDTTSSSAGFQSLLKWMQMEKFVGLKSKGFKSALDYLCKPVLSKKLTPAVSADIRSRLGSLLASSMSDDSIETIILDLFQHESKLEAALVTLVDTATTKHSSSGNAAQIDGLIAIFLLLTHSSATSSKLAPSAAKALAAGSSIKESKSSFLYSEAMNSASSTNEIVARILHPSIALYCKLVSKSAEEKGAAAKDAVVRLSDKGKPSTAAQTLAHCIINPSLSVQSSEPSPSDRICSSLKKVATYSIAGSKASDAILVALFSLVNDISEQYEVEDNALNNSKDNRTSAEPVKASYTKLPLVKGKATSPTSHKGLDPASIQRTSVMLTSSATDIDSICKALVLTHAGTSVKLTESRQREVLVTATIQLLREKIIPLSKENGYSSLAKSLADFVVSCASSRLSASSEGDQDYGAEKESESLVLSSMIHESAISLISSLGAIGGNFDPEFADEDDEDSEPYAFAHSLCVDEISARLATGLMTTLKAVKVISSDDVALLKSPAGVLFVAGKATGDSAAAAASKNAAKKRGGGKKSKGDFGAGFEEEEWERQIKEEIAAKKKAAADATGKSTSSLTEEEKKELARQDAKRKTLSSVVDGDLPRTLAAIRALCSSEIEVGNAILPVLSDSVVASVVVECPALSSDCGIDGLREQSFDTLCSLAACVYEIDEDHASTMARALAICYKDGDNGEDKDGDDINLAITALPSPCAPAACVVFEMDDVNECLSGSSFAFLFPVIKAALTGPRTAAGCEAALRILHRHTSMLAGDDADTNVIPLRKEMALTVLELLSHDRSQTFTDPTPFDALVACYATDVSDSVKGLGLSTAELAPLLGDMGALGGKNCRRASMLALSSIATSHPTRPRLMKINPLIENRIWVNCFESNQPIQSEARTAWRQVCGVESDDEAALPAPSKMYAAPLMPLLSHKDSSIANSAALAFAHAAGMHTDTAEKSIVQLCSTFIDAYPTPSSDDDSSSAAASGGGALPIMGKAIGKTASSSPFPEPPVAAPKKSKAKRIDTGLPKKPKKKMVGGTSLSKLTATTKPKKVTTTRTMPKPKIPQAKERTFDKELLESQFAAPSTKKQAQVEKDSDDKIATRLGVLRAVAALSDSSANVTLDISVLKILVSFLMTYGLADVNESVRNNARNASRDIVASNGASDEAIAFLLPHFESILSSGQADLSFLGALDKDKAPQDVTSSDRRKEGVVVALGSAALHLGGDENEEKIDETIDMLLGALNTPSEDVQSSVALCLSKLMKKGRTQDRIESILTKLMDDCLEGEKLATRRGAAYGISAVVKGSGIATLKKYEVVKQLDDACSTGTSAAKEGSLFSIELLSERLSLLFEPYVIVLLPSLLRSFSDSSDHVRTAAQHAAGKIMSKLSAHGVKLVMPAVLKAFDDPNWRTKQASITMLGSMSHCAPKQLASCLPKVVPKLTEAFSDTHPKVKTSAEEALDEISKVIRNPEIASISPILLKALIDPATGTLNGLETLIETEFLHAIDAPSLALIVPVLHRGLRDRSATTKRYGALIAGNICTMINDPRDFVPYLSTLLPDLKSVLLDPIPDVRSTSAKALGSLTRGLGEDTFPELRPWLIETLQAEEGSSVERSGAAQGLTEVLIASGGSLVEEVMLEEILPLKSHPKASTREGVLWVLTFLPSSLGQGFASLIDPSLPALLSGLADENENCRDVALRAGRVLVRSQGKPHIDKILPPLELGLSDDDYRIRVASLTLLGDLLGMLGGTKVVKGDADTQDDIRAAERAQAQIALVLGTETRMRLLSRLYLTRSDTTAVVRQISVQVWKTVVSVTPRTLREILPVLIGQIVDALASGHPEQTEVAGRCLGDIVAKLSDAVLPEIIPVLQDALYSGDEHTRRGVVVGLTEIISSSSKEQIAKYLNILVKAVQDALCDEDDGVRAMAASCFQSLYTAVGSRALDEVVPVLLSAMEREGDEDERTRAVNGLTGILSIRSKELLPYLVPRLMTKPITKNHASALGQIAAVTGDTLHTHFSTIIPGLLTELASFFGEDLDEEEKEREAAVRECSRSVCGSIEEIGVNRLISEVASKCGSDKESLRKESCEMYQVIVEERKDEADFYDDIEIILRELLYRLNDESAKVLKANHQALGALTKHVPAEELVKHIDYVRNLIASMVSDARRRKGGVGDGEFLMPGFNIPKGLEPLLPIYQRGILYGNASTREASAAGLGELISLTSTKFLAGPLVIKMTGPLLRIVGDRNTSEVKIAIIQTLGLILTKGGPSLRAFVPQFQTTFVKALSDPSRRVRVEAIKALALLMPISTRLDPLIKELVSGSLGKSSQSSAETAGAVAIQTATLEALAIVLKHGGIKAKLPESIPSALSAGKELMVHDDEGVRESAAKVVGAACGLLGVDVTSEFIDENILSGKDSSERRHGRAHCIYRILASTVGTELDNEVHNKLLDLVKTYMSDENRLAREGACVAVGAILGSAADTSACLAAVEPIMLKAMDLQQPMEIHPALAAGLCTAVRLKPDVLAGKEGLPIMDASLKLAMSGVQRVQWSFNDFLWLALKVENGGEGLEEYLSVANFDNCKSMKTLYSKVLSRQKGMTTVEDF